MDKKHFMDTVQTAFVSKKGIAVGIQTPNTLELEYVFNPYVNIPPKAHYYQNAYNEEMQLKSNPDICIKRIMIVEDWPMMEGISEPGVDFDA